MNHLVIGLGGTGGKILRSLRKTIYQSFRKEDPTGANVRYLYVDSDDQMMAHDDPTWKVLGQNVQLKQTSQLKIGGLNLIQVLDNLGNFPAISPWLGDRSQFRSILMSANAANVFGGQKRRLGRFLFACKIDDYCNQVRELVREMQIGGTADTTFHVCCGLAGGTGSGSVVDAVAQLRQMFPTPNYRILVYAMLPERDPAPNRAGTNYHANGYAALVELNALAVGAYRPYNLANAAAGRLVVQDPFNCCYLFADENEDHNRVDVDRELPDIAASFLYQKIVAVTQMSWLYLERQETFQTGNQANIPENSPAGSKPERTRTFFAFGIKQIAYPEEEIREYMTYAFARQAALQLQFNNWLDSTGYTEEPTNQDFNAYVKQKDVHQRWYITDEHLCLSLGILGSEVANKRWKPINSFWMDLLPNFTSHVRQEFAKNDPVWLAELSKLCEVAFAQNYRDQGVRKFYETARKDNKDRARELRRRVESELFQDWVAGGKSMYDISRLLAALSGELEDRQKLMEDRILKAKENADEAEKKVNANVKEWAKLGPASRWMGKHQSLFDAQAQCLQELYILRTRAEGYQFAKESLQTAIAEINLLSVEVGRCASMIAETTKDFASAIEERCADSGQVDLTKQVIRFYNPEAVKAFTRSLVLNKAEQQKQAGSVRAGLAELLGETPNFTSFNAKVSKRRFMEVMEATCERNAIAAHNNAVAISKDPILRVSVVERLAREYGGNTDLLRGYIRSIVSRAKNYISWNEAEAQIAAPGIPPANTARVSYLTIILPQAPELAEFRETLVREFQNSKPGEKELVTSIRNQHEITLINITNVFPARFVQNVAFLREKYEQRTGGDEGELSRMELHSEGDGRQFPSLYPRTPTAEERLAYAMVGSALQLIRALEDPQTGLSAMYLMGKDAQGGEILPVLLGGDLRRAADDLDARNFDVLESSARFLLDREYRHKSKRDEILAFVDGEVTKIKAERNGNPLDKVYQLFVQARKKAEAILVPRS